MPVAPRFSVLRRALSVSLLMAVAVMAGHVTGTYAGVPVGVAKAKAQKCPRGKEAARVYRGKVMIGGKKGRVVCVKRLSVPRMDTSAHQVQAWGRFVPVFAPPPRGPLVAQVAVARSLHRDALARLAVLVSARRALVSARQPVRAHAASLGSWTPNFEVGFDQTGYTATARQFDQPPEGQVGSGERAIVQKTNVARNTSDRVSTESHAFANRCPGSDGVLRGVVELRFIDSYVMIEDDPNTGQPRDVGITETLEASVQLSARVGNNGRLTQTFSFDGNGSYRLQEHASGVLEIRPIIYHVRAVPYPPRGYQLQSAQGIAFGAAPDESELVQAEAMTMAGVIEAKGGQALKDAERAWQQPNTCSHIDAPSSLRVKKGQRKPFTITVKDSKGHPVANAHVTAKATGGTITPTQVWTNNDGSTHLGYTLTKGTNGTITLTATSNRGIARTTVNVSSNSAPGTLSGTLAHTYHHLHQGQHGYSETWVRTQAQVTLRLANVTGGEAIYRVSAGTVHESYSYVNTLGAPVSASGSGTSTLRGSLIYFSAGPWAHHFDAIGIDTDNTYTITTVEETSRYSEQLGFQGLWDVSLNKSSSPTLNHLQGNYTSTEPDGNGGTVTITEMLNLAGR